MEVKLQCGDTLTIPEGCKAIVKDGSVVFEKEEKEQVFKDGDVLVSVVNRKRHNAFIYKNTDEDGFHSFYAGVNIANNLFINNIPQQRWGKDDLSYATEEEKQKLFDKMKEEGLQWNAAEKRVEKIRWRAKEGDNYWYVKIDLSTDTVTDSRHYFDGLLHKSYNYFRTRRQAKEAAKRVKETLKKYHEEIGE